MDLCLNVGLVLGLCLGIGLVLNLGLGLRLIRSLILGLGLCPLLGFYKQNHENNNKTKSYESE